MSDARSKLVILGIGDDGLAGLTEPARRLVDVGRPDPGRSSTLSLLESVPARKQALEPDMSVALRQVREALEYRQPGAGLAVAIRSSTGSPAISAIAWAKTSSRSCRTSAACNWRSRGSRRAGKTRT